MKRIFALLLALIMVFSLIACGKKPADKPGESKPSADAGPTKPKETTPLRTDIEDISPDILQQDPENKVPDSNDQYINPEKFGGKTLQIYGLSSIKYDDVENMDGIGNFLWMMRAAADEWATLNNVTLSYDGDYNANAIVGAINSGEKPDLLMLCTQTPNSSNLGITKGFSQEQYDEIASICGKQYLDMMNYKGESHGIVYPWSGNSWFRYNETMFENYGAKTPWEYYMEGNWTWETMEDCWESVTKDFDGNGKIDKTDTYGCSTAIYLAKPYYLEEDPVTAKLTCVISTNEQFRTYAEMVYRGNKETLSMGGPSNQRCSITTTPRPGTHIGDTEWYNFHSMYQVNDIGDVIRAVPIPVYSKENPLRWTQFTEHTMSMMSSCDEEEATMALICYILKVGMRVWMSDYSVGLYKCSYEGLRGASEYSRAWLERFHEGLEERRKEFAEVPEWDQETYAKMVNEVLTAPAYVQKRYTGMKFGFDAIGSMPTASALPQAEAAENAWINKYNSLYVN